MFPIAKFIEEYLNLKPGGATYPGYNVLTGRLEAADDPQNRDVWEVDQIGTRVIFDEEEMSKYQSYNVQISFNHVDDNYNWINITKNFMPNIRHLPFKRIALRNLEDVELNFVMYTFIEPETVRALQQYMDEYFHREDYTPRPKK